MKLIILLHSCVIVVCDHQFKKMIKFTALSNENPSVNRKLITISISPSGRRERTNNLKLLSSQSSVSDAETIKFQNKKKSHINNSLNNVLFIAANRAKYP